MAPGKPRMGCGVVRLEPQRIVRGKPVEVLGGFLNSEGEAYGRPVGVAIDKRGALLVADDVGNVIWRVAPSQ